MNKPLIGARKLARINELLGMWLAWHNEEWREALKAWRFEIDSKCSRLQCVSLETGKAWMIGLDFTASASSIATLAWEAMCAVARVTPGFGKIL